MSKECNNCGKILQEGENCFCSEEISAAEETESTQTEVTESTVKLSKEVTNETADEAPGKSAGEESEETSQVRLQGKKREGEEAGASRARKGPNARAAGRAECRSVEGGSGSKTISLRGE